MWIIALIAVRIIRGFCNECFGELRLSFLFVQHLGQHRVFTLIQASVVGALAFVGAEHGQRILE